MGLKAGKRKRKTACQEDGTAWVKAWRSEVGAVAGGGTVRSDLCG